MCRVLIVAYGNPLRCDDGLAWRAAEELSKQNLGPDVQVVTAHQLTPELAESVSQASSVIFIDAAQSGVPGEIVLTPLLPQTQSSVFTHDFSPSAILSLSEELYGKCPEAHSLSLVGECFDHGEELSTGVKNKLPALVALACEWIRNARLR